MGKRYVFYAALSSIAITLGAVLGFTTIAAYLWISVSKRIAP